MKEDLEKNIFVGYIFESGDNSNYGDVAFNDLISQKELRKSNSMIRFFYGDVVPEVRYVDISQYIIKNNMCTVDIEYTFKDYPFLICLKNIEESIAKQIDINMKKRCSIYKGMTEILEESIDINRYFWKKLIGDLYLEKSEFKYININGDEDIGYKECIVKNGYKYTKIDSFNNDICYELEKMSDSMKKINKELIETNPLIRNILVTNFSLNLEIRIAASLIWESIEKLSISNFINSFGDRVEHNIENIYMCLYNASQGVERLQKVLVCYIIRKYDYTKNEEEIYELLYSHNHVKLNSYILNYFKIENDSNYSKLVLALQRFYNKSRYLNYKKTKFKSNDDFYEIIYSLINNKNSDEYIKKEFGSYLGKYVNFLFNKIKEITKDDSMSPYELETDSKGNLILANDSNLYTTYLHNRIFKREVLYWLIKKGEEFIKDYEVKDFEVLNLDEQNIPLYLYELTDNSGFSIYNDINELYDELCETNKDEFLRRNKLLDDLFDCIKTKNYDD